MPEHIRFAFNRLEGWNRILHGLVSNQNPFMKGLTAISIVFLLSGLGFAQPSPKSEVTVQKLSVGKSTEAATAKPAVAQNGKESVHQLVGRWVAMNRSKGGIGSIWEFKADGTLTMAPGVVVDGPYRLEGDTLIEPPGTTKPGAEPTVTKIRVEGDHLYERRSDMTGEMHFVRIKSGKPGDAAIVGEWRTDMPSPDANRSESAALMFKNAVYTYTRDGISKLRMPFRSTAGRYDAKNQTFSLDRPGVNGQSGTFTGEFELRDGKLYLTQPDGHTKDVYIKDDFE